MKILFVHRGLETYVAKDLSILSEVYETRAIHFTGLKDVFKIFKGVIWCNLTFSWFGSLHAFWVVIFSKLLKKKSIVVSGGDEVVCMPELSYGMLSYWWKAWCPRVIFRLCNIILCVSKYNLMETSTNLNMINSKIKLLYHGFDLEHFRKDPKIEKKDLVVTIGYINEEYCRRKNYEIIARTAEKIPNNRFVFIGSIDDKNVFSRLTKISGNLEFKGQIPEQLLIQLLSEAKVYLQLSNHEAFGCSLAEAMLCECIPVVSNCGAIPEVVGDAGFFVRDIEPNNVANKILEAMSQSQDRGLRARKRIETLFPLHKRKTQLLQIVKSLDITVQV